MEKIITFENGVASDVMLFPGEYTFVSCGFPGYANAAAVNFTVTRDTKSITIPLTATGTIVVTVCDEKNNAISGASLCMSDSTGTHDYCAPIVTGSNGQATCKNLPYGTKTAPIKLWIHQLSSDAGHLPVDTPQPVSSTQGTDHAKIVNQTIS